MTTAPKTEPTLLTDAEAATEENAKRFSDYVREHPAAFIAGGVVLGVVLGALFPRKAGSAFGKRALALAATAGEIGLAASRQARDSVEKAAGDVRDRTHDLIDDSAVREKANHLASVAREVSQKAVERASTLASRLKH